MDLGARECLSVVACCFLLGVASLVHLIRSDEATWLAPSTNGTSSYGRPRDWKRVEIIRYRPQLDFHWSLSFSFLPSPLLSSFPPHPTAACVLSFGSPSRTHQKKRGVVCKSYTTPRCKSGKLRPAHGIDRGLKRPRKLSLHRHSTVSVSSLRVVVLEVAAAGARSFPVRCFFDVTRGGGRKTE